MISGTLLSGILCIIIYIKDRRKKKKRGRKKRETAECASVRKEGTWEKEEKIFLIWQSQMSYNGET